MFTFIGAIIALIITGLRLFTNAINTADVRAALWGAFFIAVGITIDFLLGKVRA